jgi:hypothetical protein
LRDNSWLNAFTPNDWDSVQVNEFDQLSVKM